MTGGTAAPTVAVAMHDGFYSCGSGAGRSNRAFLETLTTLAWPGLRLAVLPIYLSAASSEYDPLWHADMRALVQRSAAEVIPISNGSGGQVRFGRLANFRAACDAAADAINHHLVPSAAPLLVVAFDAPFYGLAAQLAPHVGRDVVVVARSTAALHAPGDPERIAWERDGLHATAAAGGRIAAISGHMGRHLATSYGAPGGALINLPNGLTRADWHTAPPAASLLPAPARRGFSFAMGRAVPYKGFDDLLDARAILKAGGVAMPHAVIAAVTDSPQPTPYQRHLAGEITARGLDATLVTRFDPRLRSILKHPALTAVIVPSRAEPFGRIPLEAFAAGAAPVVATTAGGLAELVTDGQTGYTAQPHDPISLAAALRKALACSPAERARMRAAARRVAVTRHNHEIAVAWFLAETAPWALKAQTGPTTPASTARNAAARLPNMEQIGELPSI